MKIEWVKNEWFVGERNRGEWSLSVRVSEQHAWAGPRWWVIIIEKRLGDRWWLKLSEAEWNWVNGAKVEWAVGAEWTGLRVNDSAWYEKCSNYRPYLEVRFESSACPVASLARWLRAVALRYAAWRCAEAASLRLRLRLRHYLEGPFNNARWKYTNMKPMKISS